MWATHQSQGLISFQGQGSCAWLTGTEDLSGPRRLLTKHSNTGTYTNKQTNKTSIGLERTSCQPDEQRTNPTLGRASTKPNLKKLVAEKLVRFSFPFKVNPDGVFVRTQKIPHIRSTWSIWDFTSFLPVFSFLEEQWYTTGRRIRTPMYSN